jgi:hypothetical protein
MNTTPCPHCARARASGWGRCHYCGRAYPLGREPTDAERYETSEEARQARLMRAEAAHRDAERLDAMVLASARRLRPRGRDFVWTDLADTGMTVCALKHALERLAERGRVRIVGRAKIRPCRFRPIFRVLPTPGTPEHARALAEPTPPMGAASSIDELAPPFPLSEATIMPPAGPDPDPAPAPPSPPPPAPVPAPSAQPAIGTPIADATARAAEAPARAGDASDASARPTG